VHCAGSGGFTAEHVARCSRIPHVVERPTDVIGAVDAVVIATAIGSEYVKLARPFVEAGLPVAASHCLPTFPIASAVTARLSL
jgi:hypothetical protein